MFKSTLALLFVVVALEFAFSTPATAQVQGCQVWVACGQYSLWDATCYPAIPLGATNCNGFDWTTYCQVPFYKCAPPDAAPETRCGCSSPGTGGGPINLATGNTYIQEADIKNPGLGGGLTLERTWNSMWPATQNAYQVGLFGPNWRSNFEERIFLGSDNYVKYARGDGSFWSLAYNAAGGYGVAAPGNQDATLVQGSSYWTLTFKNGEQRLFDNTSGNLIAIIDRNGNTTQLSYDAVGRLNTVTDPASRHLYFSYASQTSFLVTSVTSDFGVSTSYSYDSQGRLLQVTEPDGSTLNFTYNSQSLVASVTDSNGVVLESHTYDSSGRGLTSSRANGVDAITVTYQSQ
ncbi:MAG: DUF6531 domain-containing protein [Candidatus Acidiferrales bacterium]